MMSTIMPGAGGDSPKLKGENPQHGGRAEEED